MSARVESTPIRDPYSGTIAIAIVVALAVGALLGTVVTKAVDHGPAAVATPVGAQLWDSQKLGAMEGRALAEQYRIAQPVTWDQQKLDAMAGRVLFQPVVVQTDVPTTAKPSSTRPFIQGGWDAYKLKAMEGRVLAAQAGAEDPPVKPHLPKRPPSG
ncbi:MAG TPA: hypothetical protein VFM81_09950 [Actinomycetota bacterium]|nr:hypothetical protein [Actinomycetota bacterium]